MDFVKRFPFGVAAGGVYSYWRSRSRPLAGKDVFNISDDQDYWEVDRRRYVELWKTRLTSLGNTTEGSLRILPSRVTGVCGVNTGNGVFTMAAIPPNTWVCSYAPSAPFEGATNAQGDYTLEFAWRSHKLSVNGDKCNVGLGRLLNDGRGAGREVDDTHLWPCQGMRWYQ